MQANLNAIEEKTTLTETEQVEAQKHEKIVEEGLAGYVATGAALGTIRDEHLHVGPFKEYVVDRFEIEYHTANRRILAARVAHNLKAAGLPIPANEDQAYKLHDLEEGKQRKVWEKVLNKAKKNGVRVTTKMILEVLGQKPQPRMAKANKNGDNSTAEMEPQAASMAIPSNEKLEAPVVVASLAVRKAVTALQAAFNALEGAEIAAYEELDAKLSEVAALVNGIRGLLPAKSGEPLKLVG